MRTSRNLPVLATDSPPPVPMVPAQYAQSTLSLTQLLAILRARRGQVILIALLILAVWMGLYPTPFIQRLETSVNRVVMRVNPEYRALLTVPAPAAAAVPVASPVASRGQN